MIFRFLFFTLFSILTFSINAQTFALPSEVEELTDRWKKQELKDYLKAVLSNVIALRDAHNGEIEELKFAHDGEIEAMDKMLEAYLLQIRSLKQDSLLLDKQLGVLVDSIITLHNDYQQIGILRDSLENSMTLLITANQKVSLLSDSLALKDSLLKTLYDVGRITSNDFLNHFAKSQVITQENVTLTFSFHHAMLINGGFLLERDWNQPKVTHYVLKDSAVSAGYTAEYLDFSDIDVWFSGESIPYYYRRDYESRYEDNIVFNKQNIEYSTYLDVKTSWDVFNDYFPKVKLSDGVFLSLKGGHLKEGVQKHFIVSYETLDNYGKLQYHWRLAEGNQLSENDFTLDIHEVEGEFYMALDISQLKRFGFSIFPHHRDGNSGHQAFAFTRAGLKEVIDPLDLLFFFKLKEE